MGCEVYRRQLFSFPSPFCLQIFFASTTEECVIQQLASPKAVVPVFSIK